MVLQSNFAKRIASDAENHPIDHFGASGKALGSRVRTTLQDAARRRRARTNGTSRTPKYAVEQAKRRSTTKSPSTVTSVKFTVTTIPGTTPPATNTDVEMKDAGPSSSKISTVPVLLPRELGRPEFQEISKEAIEAVAPELIGTDLDYIRDNLEEFGPRYAPLRDDTKNRPTYFHLPL